MTNLRKLRHNGVGLLAPRGEILGSKPCGGSQVVFWEDVDILREADIPVRIYGKTADKERAVKILSTITNKNVRLMTSLEYCGKFVWQERNAAILLAYNEPTVAFFAPRRAIIRFDWPTPLPKYGRVPIWQGRFQQGTYLFPSESLRKQFLERHSFISKNATLVIPNAVDLDDFQPKDGKASLSNPPRVGFAGQFIPDKGVQILCEAWKMLKKRGIKAELRLAGGGNLWKRSTPAPGVNTVTEKLAEITPDEQVKLTGELPRDQMPEFWRSLDVAVVPSIWQESFGLTALEAMASGVPVIASAVGGLKEIVAEEVSGLLIPPEEPKKLADALCKLLVDDSLRSRLAKGARRQAEKFSIENRAKMLLNLLSKIVEPVDS